ALIAVLLPDPESPVTTITWGFLALIFNSCKSKSGNTSNWGRLLNRAGTKEGASGPPRKKKARPVSVREGVPLSSFPNRKPSMSHPVFQDRRQARNPRLPAE